MTRHVLFLTSIFFGLVAERVWAEDKIDDRTTVRKDSHGRKFVNKIPYDVFFDRPLEIVASQKNTLAAPAPSSKNAESTPAEKAQDSPSSAAGDVQWQALVPIDELQSEVKTLRNRLTRGLTNQSQFRQSVKELSMDGTEIAALAVIAQQHKESISWKDKSQYVREFGTQISSAATGLSKENFDETKSAFQRLTSVLDGSIPAYSEDVPSVRSFHEAAGRKGLMKRMEKAKDWLKQDVNSEAKLKSMSDQVRHESAILAALATVIRQPGYDYTENEDYQNYAKQLIQGALDASEASTNDAFGKFKQAVDQINKSCTDCHGSYGNG